MIMVILYILYIIKNIIREINSRIAFSSKDHVGYIIRACLVGLHFKNYGFISGSSIQISLALRALTFKKN